MTVPGGYDDSIDLEIEYSTLENVLSQYATHISWDDAVFEYEEENGEDVAKFIFVYRNEEARQSWEELGWDETNCNDMFYIIHYSNPGLVCCVAETESQIEDVLSYVQAFG